MKWIVALFGVLALLGSAGCARDHTRSPAGGTYEGSAPAGYGHGEGEFLGYPDYPDYRENRDYP